MTLINRVKFLSVFVFILVSALCTNIAAATNDNPKFQDWEVKCGKTSQQQKDCFLVQTVSNKVTKKPILQAMIGYMPAQNEPSFIFTIANLLPLDTKMELIFSKTFAISFKLASCRKKLLVCIAMVKLDKKLLQTISKGEVAYLSFPFDGKQRQVPISLLGINKGILAIKKYP